jgi:hypothetical protein
LGSGAPEIGRQVADIIHGDYVDREIIAEVAARLHRQKQDVADKEMPPTSLFERIVEALGRTGAYEGVALPAWQIPLDDTRYLTGLESVIRELAESQSIVIRGRGSQFILKDYTRVLHVLVVAPSELRLKRVMESMKLDKAAATHEMERFDNSGREFIRRYFQAELEHPAHYDLVINTKHLSFEAATSIVVHTLPLKDGAAGGKAKID